MSYAEKFCATCGRLLRDCVCPAIINRADFGEYDKLKEELRVANQDCIDSDRKCEKLKEELFNVQQSMLTEGIERGKLEDENEKLKTQNERLKKDNWQMINTESTERRRLETENKKLKEDRDLWQESEASCNQQYNELLDENRKLTQELDTCVKMSCSIIDDLNVEIELYKNGDVGYSRHWAETLNAMTGKHHKKLVENEELKQLNKIHTEHITDHHVEIEKLKALLQEATEFEEMEHDYCHSPSAMTWRQKVEKALEAKE